MMRLSNDETARRGYSVRLMAGVVVKGILIKMVNKCRLCGRWDGPGTPLDSRELSWKIEGEEGEGQAVRVKRHF